MSDVLVSVVVLGRSDLSQSGVTVSAVGSGTGEGSKTERH